MPVFKRKYRSGQTVWFYEFNGPGSTREARNRVTGSGFATKREAEEAETNRRIEERDKEKMAKAGGPVDAPLPKTLAMLLEEFFL